MSFVVKRRYKGNYNHHNNHAEPHNRIWRPPLAPNPFKKNNVNPPQPPRFNVHKIRNYLHNGDVRMANNVKKYPTAGISPMRGRILGSVSTRGRGGASFSGRSVLGRPSYWFKVTLFHAKTYGRQEIIKKIQDYISPVILAPFGVQEDGDNVTFYIDNKKTSNAIILANLKLVMQDGSMLQIKVESKQPLAEITADLRQKITLVMSSKYNDITKHLDLSRFFSNQVFLQQDLFVSLSTPTVASCICEIIGQHIPNVKSLDLSCNKIITMQHFHTLKNFAKDLKTLNLSKNRINNLTDLKPLEGLKLESLVLDCNPICDYFKVKTLYVREIRKLFPTLIFLDEHVLPSPAPRVSAVASQTSTVPAAQTPNTNSSNQDGRVFTRQFLQTFYSMYDNAQGDRSALKEAYALTAEFSLTTSNFTSVNCNKFVTANRNSIRVNNHIEGKTELMLIGQQDIVRFLSTLPKTQHDLNSFNIDLLLFSPELVSLRIRGVFREAEYDPSPIKSFNREFTLISSGTGYSIVKDGLCITEASSEETTNAFGSNPSSSQQVSDVSNLLKSSLSLENNPSTSSTSTSMTEENKVAELSKLSGMNLLWSKKCLSETEWDLEKALRAFTLFKDKIPAEAFVV